MSFQGTLICLIFGRKKIRLLSVVWRKNLNLGLERGAREKKIEWLLMNTGIKGGWKKKKRSYEVGGDKFLRARCMEGHGNRQLACIFYREEEFHVFGISHFPAGEPPLLENPILLF
jgi:hypothetical protein